MTSPTPLACRCGSLRGTAHLSPNRIARVICHCTDCRAYSRFLDGDAFLDPWGGSELVQMSPACVRLTGGQEHLAAIRLTPTGMRRWYASCCRTPVGNTLANRRPLFVGMGLPFLKVPETDLSTVLGREAVRAHPSEAIDAESPLPSVPHFGWRDGLHIVGLMARWNLAGGPTPFFIDGRPRVEAEVMEPEQLQALKAWVPGPAPEVGPVV